MFKEQYIKDNQIINPDDALIDRISAQMAEQIELNTSGRTIPFGNVTKILACAACACLVIGAAILLPNMSGIKTADTTAATTTAAANGMPTDEMLSAEATTEENSLAGAGETVKAPENTAAVTTQSTLPPQNGDTYADYVNDSNASTVDGGIVGTESAGSAADAVINDDCDDTLEISDDAPASGNSDKDVETNDDADIEDDDVAVGDEIDPVDDDVAVEDDTVSNDADFDDDVDDSDEVSDEVLTVSTDTDGRFPTLGAFAEILGSDYGLTLSVDREKFEKAMKLASPAKSLKEATYPGSYNQITGWSESGGYDFEIMMPLTGRYIVVYIRYNDGRPNDWIIFEASEEQWSALDSVFRQPPSYEECTVGKVAAYLDGYLTNAEATVETTTITSSGESWNTLTLDKKKTAQLLERAAALDFDISGDMYAVADASTVSVSIVDRSSRCGILISLWDYSGYDVLMVQYGDRLGSDGTVTNRYYSAPMNIPDGSFETLYEIFTGKSAPDGRISVENKRPDIDSDEVDEDEPDFVTDDIEPEDDDSEVPVEFETDD